jgi:hypothetical protein
MANHITEQDLCPIEWDCLFNMIEEERMEHPDWDDDTLSEFVQSHRAKQLMERINDHAQR